MSSINNLAHNTSSVNGMVVINLVKYFILILRSTRQNRTTFESSLLRIILMLFLLIGLCQYGYGGNGTEPSSKTYIDYLQYNNDSLEVLYKSADTKDEKKVLASILLDRGYTAKNPDEVFNAYQKLQKLESSKEVSLLYIDSLLKYSTISPREHYPEQAYYLKGLLYYKFGEYDLSMEFYSQAHKLALSKKNQKIIIYTNHAIALLKNTIFRYDEATSTFEENLKYIQINKLEYELSKTYIATLYALGNAYNISGEFNKANEVIEKGISFAKQIKAINFEYYFKLLKGGSCALQGKFEDAISNVTSVIGLESFDSQTYTAALNILTTSYFGLNQVDNALNMLVELDSIYKHHPAALLQVSEGYKGYSDYYSKIGNAEKELYYLKIQEKINSELQTDRIKLGEKIGVLETSRKHLHRNHIRFRDHQIYETRYFKQIYQY